jgi:hypothetical protein
MKRYIGFLLLLSTLSLSAQNYTKQFISNSSSELTLNCSSANAFEIVLGSNVTISLSNITGAKGIRLWLVQDGTGNRVVHYSSQFTFSPLFKDTTSLTANKTTVVEFTINDGKIYCTYNSNIAGGSSSGGGISTVNTTAPILGDGSSGSPVRADTTKAQGRLATYNDVLRKQDKLNGGIGFVKSNSGTISYDNSTYLTTTGNGSSLTGITASQVGAATLNDTALGSASRKLGTAYQIALINTQLSSFAFGSLDSIGNVNTNQTLSYSNYNYAKIILTGSITMTFSASSPRLISRIVNLEIKQGGSGSYTITSWTGVLFPGGVLPVLSSNVGAVDVLTFVWNGVKWVLQNISYNIQ